MMTRTEQQRKAYFKWLDMLAEQMHIDRINTAMLVHNMTINGYEVPVTAALVNSWFDDACLALDTAWGKLKKEVKSAIFGGIRKLLHSLGVDTARTITGSRRQFCLDIEGVAKECGATITTNANDLLERKLQSVPLSGEVLHHTFAKQRFMSVIAPDITTTNKLSTKQFQQLCEAMAKWALECGVRNLPPFPDRNRVPVGCYA